MGERQMTHLNLEVDDDLRARIQQYAGYHGFGVADAARILLRYALDSIPVMPDYDRDASRQPGTF